MENKIGKIEITEQEADKLATILNIAIKAQGLLIISDVQLFVDKLKIAFTEPIKEENNELNIK